MPKVSGFTIVRNAVKLDFPLEASIRSILPLCDEVVVNVGRSEDATLDLVRAIRDPKIRILERISSSFFRRRTPQRAASPRPRQPSTELPVCQGRGRSISGLAG